MPELPEVETVRRSLEPAIAGARIGGVTLGAFAGVIGESSAEVLLAAVAGRAITAVRRRGKYLIVDLDDGGALIVHLRMTGQLLLMPRDAPPLRFEHLAVH